MTSQIQLDPVELTPPSDSDIPLGPRRCSNPAAFRPKRRLRGSSLKGPSPFQKVGQGLLSIRVLTIIVVVSMVVAAAAIASVTQHFIAKTGVDQLTDSVRFILRESVAAQVSHILDNALLLIRLDNQTFNYNIHNKSMNDLLPYLEHQYRLLQSAKVVGSLVFGNDYDDIIGVRRTTEYEFALDNTTSPYLYNYAVNGTFNLALYTVNSSTLGYGNYISSELNFHVSSRKWYVLGKNDTYGDFVWSTIFLNVQNTLTVTAAQAFYNTSGGFLGVLGVNIFLGQIKEYLISLPTNNDNLIILVDGQGNLIADSCPFNQTDMRVLTTCGEAGLRADTPVLVNIKDLTGIYKQLASLMSNLQASNSRTTILNGDYWVSFQPITSHNLAWVAIVLTRIEAYESSVRRANIYTIVFSCVFCFAAAIVAFLLGLAVTRPIGRMVGQVDVISSMKFGAPPSGKVHTRPSKSAIYEISTMQKSLSRMNKAIASFEKFVPNTVVKDLLRKDVEAHLGVDSCFTSLFFCDIEDFTTISELMAPTQLVAMLQDFLQEMSSIISDETEGTIDKFIGDAIMAFWNAPHPVDKHELKACAAAIRCQKKLSTEVRHRWATPGIPPLKMRIGIHSGEVLVGNIGSVTRISYTAIGDNVNIAAHLESLCKFYGVNTIISAATYVQAISEFLCRPLDLVHVTKKSSPILLYELIDELALATEEDVLKCTRTEKAYALAFLDKNQPLAIEAFEDLVGTYPDDVAIKTVLKRLIKLRDTKEWPGFEDTTHK